jgi:hypothetical protein
MNIYLMKNELPVCPYICLLVSYSMTIIVRANPLSHLEVDDQYQSKYYFIYRYKRL